MRILLFILIAIFSGCYSTSNDVSQDDIEHKYEIESLIDVPYYFPAKNESESNYVIQPLKRFDMIFVGHDSNSTSRYLSYATPGKYTHLLIYLGKDSNGFAYAAEMNGLANKGISLDISKGFSASGRFSVYCLGDDYGENSCLKDTYIHGMETYDFMWAKRLKPELYQQLIQHEKELLSVMKEDLMMAYPTQLPFYIGFETILSKMILLVDDGRINGADCTAYFSSLFEEITGVCMENIRINAEELESYYRNDPIGQLAMIPAEYNPLSSQNLYISELLRDKGYRFIDNTARQTLCSDKRIVSGVPTPDLIFNSLSMEEIR